MTIPAKKRIIVDRILLLGKNMFYQNQHFGISEYFCKEMGENFSFPAHIHHSFELITVLEGHMMVTVGTDRYELSVGEGIVVFPEQIHSLGSTKSRHLLVIFSADIVNAYYSKHASEIPQSGKITLPDYLLNQISLLESSTPSVKKKAVLYSVCALLDESTEYKKRKNAENGLLRAIFEFVEGNFQKNCTLEELGNATGYNRSYLSRYFSEATNMSFLSFVNRRRISKACELLKSSDKTVIECAYDCGYTSLRSFNRNFKLYIGVSPKEYRNNA